MEYSSISKLFANYVHEGKWDIENVPAPFREEVDLILKELKGGEENV